MSRIYEALRQAERQGGPEFAPGLIDPTAETFANPVESPARKSEPEASSPTLSSSPAPPVLQAAGAQPAQAEEELRVELMRTLPLRVKDSAPVLPFDEERAEAYSWDASEQYRMIRTKIQQHPRSPRMIVISSPGPGDGKSLTAINLAGALSLKAISRVLLVDADFRRPSIHMQTGLPDTPGLADALEGRCGIEDAVVQAEQLPNLYILPAGAVPTNPAELLDSPQWISLCRTLRKTFEYVVVDSPPIAAVTDFDLIQAVCDGIVLVLRPDHTNRAACFQALQASGRDKLIGVAMNCVENWFLFQSARYDSYYSQGAGAKR